MNNYHDDDEYDRLVKDAEDYQANAAKLAGPLKPQNGYGLKQLGQYSRPNVQVTTCFKSSQGRH
jgi:hypothetical protein